MIGLVNADSIRIPLADKSVHTCITSPPYWALRKYSGIEGAIWPNITYTPMTGLAPITIPGDAGCEHVWGEQIITQKKGYDGEDKSTLTSSGNRHFEANIHEIQQGQWCQRCGAWRGMLGLEPSPEMYVAHIVAIMREVKRVLRDDGTLWLNLGDSYSGSNKGSGRKAYGGAKQRTNTGSIGLPVQEWEETGLKPKDLCGIPWRVAFALQADGWYLRSDIIWAKGISFCEDYAGSAMPESVTDRCTKGHEYLFMLAKDRHYFWDQEAVKEPGAKPRKWKPETRGSGEQWLSEGGAASRMAKGATGFGTTGTRNLRDVWTINPGSYPGAHYAVFPPELVEPCIKAGASEYGCCSECGASYERVMEKSGRERIPRYPGDNRIRDSKMNMPPSWNTYNTTGWESTCDHNAEVVPTTVLDIFAGSGTTGEVARRLGRNSVLIDLSHEYLVEQAVKRLEIDKWDAWHNGGKQAETELDGLPMFDGLG